MFRPSGRGRRKWLYAAPATAAAIWSHALAQSAPPVSQASSAAGSTSQTPPKASAKAPQERRTSLIAPLILNDKNLGDITVEVDTEGHATIDGPRLMALLGDLLSPSVRSALETQIGGRTEVPVEQLSQAGLVFSFDMATLEAHIEASRDSLRVEQVSVFGRGAPDFARMRPPARLAAAINATVDQVYTRSLGETERQPLKVGIDGVVTAGGFGGTVFRFGGLWSDLSSGTKWTRAQTSLSRDFFNSAIRVSAGEFNVPVTGFQRGGAALGVSVSRDYDGIRPFENIHPSGRSALTLDRDSTVIVLVNGVETRRMRMAPGRYQFSDFGAPYGSSSVKLVVEDIYGRREVASLALFNSTNLLASGVTDFAFSAAQRPSFNQGEYAGPVIASGYWRRGFGDRLTLGGGGQFGGGNSLASGELSLGARPGILGLTAAVSRYRGRSGTAAALDFRHEHQGHLQKSFVATVSAETMSANFASPWQTAPSQNDERWRVDSRLEWRSAVRTLALGLHAEAFRHSPAERRLEFSATRTYRRLSTALTLGVERGPRGGYGGYVMLALNLRLGERTSANALYDTRAPHSRTLNISRYADQAVGDLSGRIQVSQDSDHQGVSGYVDYYGNRMLAHAEDNVIYTDDANGGDTRLSDLRVSSALVFADGAWSLARPAPRGFIAFPVHDSLKGARVIVRDEAGRIAGKGGVLPAVTPLEGVYLERTYTYDVTGAPDTYDFGDTTAHVFPGAATGYRVQIGSPYWKLALGYLSQDGAPLAQQTFELRSLTDKAFAPQTIFTNSAGRFAADSLGPGEYEIVFNEAPVARFTIPNDKKGLINVGKIDISRPGQPGR